MTELFVWYCAICDDNYTASDDNCPRCNRREESKRNKNFVMYLPECANICDLYGKSGPVTDCDVGWKSCYACYCNFPPRETNYCPCCRGELS